MQAGLCKGTVGAQLGMAAVIGAIIFSGKTETT
jgi:hypothetical protein